MKKEYTLEETLASMDRIQLNLDAIVKIIKEQRKEHQEQMKVLL